MKLTGGCFCGAVRFELSGDPLRVTHCHCIHCRRIHGAPFVTWGEIGKADYKITNGEPRYHESRPNIRRSFCGKCGSPLTYENMDWPRTIDLVACALDQPECLSPEDHVWSDRMLPWIHIDDGLPRHALKRPPSE